MSTHERAAIRDAVIDTLIAAKTDCGDRVSSFPTQPLQPDDMPAIAVYALSETVDTEESSVHADADTPGCLKRLLQLAIEIMVAGDSGEADADRIALQAETAIDADPTIGQRVSDTMLSGTEFGFVSNTEKIIAVARLTYQITYYTPTRTAEATAGTPITTVYGGLAPDIGAAHKDDYVVIAKPE